MYLGAANIEIRRIDSSRPTLAVIHASDEELAAHRAWLEELDKQSAGRCVWRQLESSQ